MKRAATLIGLVAALAIPTADARSTTQVDALVSQFAGVSLTVRAGQDGGMASYLNGRILMLPAYYREVLAMPHGDSMWQAWTLYVLAHETGHAVRGDSQVHANQWALNHYKPFAVAFGFTPKQANAMYREARRDIIAYDHQRVG